MAIVAIIATMTGILQFVVLLIVLFWAVGITLLTWSWRASKYTVTKTYDFSEEALRTGLDKGEIVLEIARDRAGNIVDVSVSKGQSAIQSGVDLAHWSMRTIKYQLLLPWNDYKRGHADRLAEEEEKRIANETLHAEPAKPSTNPVNAAPGIPPGEPAP